MKYLVLWEIGKKQSYIFRSNKIKEIIGASLIIKNLSENFPELDEEHIITKGGGKVIYWFNEEEKRKEFIMKKSCEILKKYPGLEIFFVTEDYDEKQEISEAIQNLYSKLDRKKRSCKNSCGKVGFGIERKCYSTGGLAYDRTDDDEKRYISREVAVKIETARNKDDNKWLKELDDMTSDGKKSFISIIHIDGNGMGKKIEKINNKLKRECNESIQAFNKRYIKTVKDFSNKIAEANSEAFDYVCEVIERNVDKIKDITKIEEGKIPIRPLIMAGDDVTFICNGAIGIECAKIFIEKLTEKEIDIEGISDPEVKKLTACAGISIVKKNYPFIKAYEMAEELCENAKEFLGENKMSHSALDFHLCQGEVSSSIKEIRREKYQIDDLILTMKPYCIGDSSGLKEDKWRSYDNFLLSLNNVNKIISDNKENKNIGISRSKVKQLREEFSKGEEAVKMFMEYYDVNLESVFSSLDNTKGNYCFYKSNNKKWCMYLDAIEVMDIFQRLD